LHEIQRQKRLAEKAESLAGKLDIETELLAERQRKLPRRLDDNPATAVTLSAMDKLKASFYYPVLDKFTTEVKQTTIP